ncbi:COX15/CtaA family protein [bacterium]|jgi:heme a synthase|nr:COX15/CtaA family protein [bacterium]
MNKNIKLYLSVWLIFIVIFTSVMVLVGGITRLTESGLSMVTWRPITGILPPLGSEQWQQTFMDYQKTPEFIKKNSHMTLHDFKSIFFWEYIHRVLGRLTGLVALMPFFGLLFFSRLPGRDKLKYFSLPVLVGGQGCLGWYMVVSGLVDNPNVSHFRLAAHLLMAFLIVGVGLYFLFDLHIKKRKIDSLKIRTLVKGMFVCLVLQIMYGAFTAGLKGGHGFNTFPKMGDAFFPLEFLNSGSFMMVIVNHPFVVQFMHRWLGILVWVFAGCLFVYNFKRHRKSSAPILGSLFLALTIQVGLGIATLLSFVAIPLAVAHQLFALAVFSLFIYALR